MLTVVFAVLYSLISLTFQYYGEMITYLGMTAPIAVLSTITWFRHPHKKGENEVQVAVVAPTQWLLLILSTAAVTFVFYFILKAFHTSNLAISTVSIATSFLASALTLMRSPAVRSGIRRKRYCSGDYVDHGDGRKSCLSADGDLLCRLPRQRLLRLLELAENEKTAGSPCSARPDGQNAGIDPDAG